MFKFKWYKWAQNQNLYDELGNLGISLNQDGSFNIYTLSDTGDIDFHQPPKIVADINKAISQQYIIYEATQDELVKYLAFLDDLVLFVEKLNDFPILNIPQATEGMEVPKVIPPGVEQPDSELLEEEVIEENEEIEKIDENEINKPYPYVPDAPESYNPQYGYWYYPFNLNEYQEKSPEEIDEELKQREILEIPPFSEQEELIPPIDIPENSDIVQEIEENTGEITETSQGNAANVAQMIRQKYVVPLSRAKDELKIELRNRFEELAQAYESLNFSSSLSVINMATRVRLEKDIRGKFENSLNFIDNRIKILEDLLNKIQNGEIFYPKPLENIGIKMQEYEIQRQNNNIFRVVKPHQQGIYYTDMTRRVCTCPWGRKTSPYQYEASACKHYKWIASLVRGSKI